MPAHQPAPWDTPKPKSKKSSKPKTKLSPESIKWAKSRASKAGRRYPNLVDNMAASRHQAEHTAKQKPGHSRP